MKIIIYFYFISTVTSEILAKTIPHHAFILNYRCYKKQKVYAIFEI